MSTLRENANKAVKMAEIRKVAEIGKRAEAEAAARKKPTKKAKQIKTIPVAELLRRQAEAKNKGEPYVPGCTYRANCAHCRKAAIARQNLENVAAAEAQEATAKAVREVAAAIEAVQLLETTKQTISLPVFDFRDLIEGALVCVSDDDLLPTINSILLQSDGTTVTAAATDRYRLLRGTIESHTDHLRPTMIRADHVKAILALIKKQAKRFSGFPDLRVSLSRLGAEVTFTIKDEGLIFPAHGGEFPPISHLFAIREANPIAEIDINGNLLQSFAKVPGNVGGRVGLKFTKDDKGAAMSPIEITLEHPTIKWQALLMPMRKGGN